MHISYISIHNTLVQDCIIKKGPLQQQQHPDDSCTKDLPVPLRGSSVFVMHEEKQKEVVMRTHFK